MRITDETAKLTDTYSLRIPHKTKLLIDECLSTEHKVELNNQIRLLIAKKIHAAKFNPLEYLGDEDIEREGP